MIEILIFLIHFLKNLFIPHILNFHLYDLFLKYLFISYNSILITIYTFLHSIISLTFYSLFISFHLFHYIFIQLNFISI
jgi:hypothetical protein